MYFYKPVISYRASNKHAAASIIPQHPPQDGHMGHTHVHTNHGDDDCCTSNYNTTLGKVQLKQLNPESAEQKKMIGNLCARTYGTLGISFGVWEVPEPALLHLSSQL